VLEGHNVRVLQRCVTGVHVSDVYDDSVDSYSVHVLSCDLLFVIFML